MTVRLDLSLINKIGNHPSPAVLQKNWRRFLIRIGFILNRKDGHRQQLRQMDMQWPAVSGGLNRALMAENMPSGPVLGDHQDKRPAFKAMVPPEPLFNSDLEQEVRQLLQDLIAVEQQLAQAAGVELQVWLDLGYGLNWEQAKQRDQLLSLQHELTTSGSLLNALKTQAWISNQIPDQDSDGHQAFLDDQPLEVAQRYMSFRFKSWGTQEGALLQRQALEKVQGENNVSQEAWEQLWRQRDELRLKLTHLALSDDLEARELTSAGMGRWPWLQKLYDNLESSLLPQWGAKWSAIIAQAWAPALLETGLAVGTLTYGIQALVNVISPGLLGTGLAFWISLAISLGLWQMGHLPWQTLGTQPLAQMIAKQGRQMMSKPLVIITGSSLLATALLQPTGVASAMLLWAVLIAIHVLVNSTALARKARPAAFTSRTEQGALGKHLMKVQALTQGANSLLTKKRAFWEKGIGRGMQWLLFSPMVPAAGRMLRMGLGPWLNSHGQLWRKLATPAAPWEQPVRRLIVQQLLEQDADSAVNALSGPSIKVEVLSPYNRHFMQGTLGIGGGYYWQGQTLTLLVAPYLLDSLAATPQAAASLSFRLRRQLLALMSAQATRIYIHQPAKVSVRQPAPKPPALVQVFMALSLRLAGRLPSSYRRVVHRFWLSRQPQAYRVFQFGQDHSGLAQALLDHTSTLYQAYLLYYKEPSDKTRAAWWHQAVLAMVPVGHQNQAVALQANLATFSRINTMMGVKQTTVGHWRQTGDHQQADLIYLPHAWLVNPDHVKLKSSMRHLLGQARPEALQLNRVWHRGIPLKPSLAGSV